VRRLGEIRGDLPPGHYLARKVNESLTRSISDQETDETSAQFFSARGHPLADLQTIYSAFS
jgi:hypothetical protein